MAKSLRIIVSMGEDYRKLLLELSANRHQTISQVVRDAIEHYYRMVKNNEKDKPLEV